MLHPTILNGVIVRETNIFHGVQRGSLVINLPTVEDLFLKEEQNLPQIDDFPTSHDTKHQDL